ncbi:hypothetical protein DL96DRAFT_1589446 [Flagelloscypha sp. PMI_526]|nr:hypothetical protein DL96DRAFT_1589446 [Flagelloscypha sp. PMI_526]
MFFPSFFFTLVLALHCVDAAVIFRLGNTSQAVTKIREGTDFANADASGNIPADATKGLSVSTNIIPPKDAPKIAQLIANANAATGAAKKTADAAVTKALKGLKPLGVNPNAVWQADFSATTFAGFGLKADPNSDPGHSLLTVTTPIASNQIQATLNSKFTKVDPATVLSMVLTLGGNPKAQAAPAAANAATPAAPPAAAPPAAAPAKPAAPVTPPAAPAKPAAPVTPPAAPKPAAPVVPKPAAPKPVVPKPVAMPKPGKKIREEPLRMRRVRRAL